MKLNFRAAQAEDLKTLVDMLADDPLGVKRENPSDPRDSRYLQAFDAIDSDPNNELIVACNDSNIVGQLQLTFIPYLTYIGSWRCLVEGARIHKDFRSEGLGTQLFEWAISRAKERNCRLIQLTSDKQQPEAISFYEKLGFKASHEGLKLNLQEGI